MKAKRFSEINSLEWQNAYKVVKDVLEESVKTCDYRNIDFYKDVTLFEYRNNLIEVCWYDNEDGEECHCKGINALSQYIIIEDEEDDNVLCDMFDQARDEVWQSLIDEICECDEDCDEIQSMGDWDDYVAYDDYCELDDAGAFECRNVFGDVLANGGNIRQFAKYFNFCLYDDKEECCLKVYAKQ